MGKRKDELKHFQDNSIITGGEKITTGFFYGGQIKELHL